MTSELAALALPTQAARRFEAVLVLGDADQTWPEQPVLAVVQVAPEAEAVRRALAELWRRGIGPQDVLVLVAGSGPELPPGPVRVPVGPDGVLAVLLDQAARRERRELPELHPPEGWGLALDGVHPERERVWEALLALADGRVGVTGAPVAGHPAARPTALVAGVYDGEDAGTHLLPAPLSVHLPHELPAEPVVHRVLDLHAGVLREDERTVAGEVAALRFVSLSRPGVVVLRADCPGGASQLPDLRPPADALRLESGTDGSASWMRVPATSGGVTTAGRTTTAAARHGRRTVDRVAAYDGHPDVLPPPAAALARAELAAEAGFERLLHEHRRLWAARWDDADVSVEGDAGLQLAVRLMLFHLMGSVGDRGEAAVGARGITGHGYSGHVFWDADTFVLPFFAATHPACARAMLEYRLRRLPEAMAAARALGRAGARFPWESARTGRDVTPTSACDRAGRVIEVRTGPYEEHIVAEVAWAASTYVDWTGDLDFARGAGLRLLVETARWWASRIEVDPDGSGHIRGVIGPDEYHEDVDDDAFTNVMARWNLRRAATAVAEPAAGDAGVDERERERWLELAGAMVDGYDPATGRHEQFAGFDDLEPLVIAEVAPRRPIAADVLMGRQRVQATQVVKQPAVLMLHHLVPDELRAGTLPADLAYYEPRTAHGSSLSPGVHAALLARAGKVERALEALGTTARIDLDDLTGTTASGIHMATAGALWQAMVMGFAGVRPAGPRLVVDPHVPAMWGALEIRLRFRGSRVRLRCTAADVDVWADPPVPVSVRGAPATATPEGLRPETTRTPGGTA